MLPGAGAMPMAGAPPAGGGKRRQQMAAMRQGKVAF
jgi:hypothetical protein